MTKFLLIISILLMNLCNLIALDIKKDIEGEKCAVIEPVGNFTFDLTEIQSELGYHINGNDDNMGQYFFNLCKPLSRKCNNQTAAACLKKHHSGEEVIIGYDSKLYWNEGQIRLSYVGELCKDKTNYTLNVMLHCDYHETKNDFLGVFHLEDQCEVNIIMKTTKACLPLPDNVKNAKLFVKTPTNQTLNFNALRSSNHIAEKSNGSFVIGFPVLYGHEIMCEGGTTVCFINNTETDVKNKYKNMGVMTSDIKFENDYPVLMLTSNEECKGTKKYSSKIVFKCDKLRNEGSPRFIKDDDCVNYFEWETKHACVEEKSCQISGQNGELYDLSSLVGLQYQVPRSNKTNEVVHFSLCSPAKECGDENWGSCIIKTNEKGSRQTTSIGNFNKNLKIDKKNVFLKYESGGSKCNGNGEFFSTRIEFIVADNPEDEEVVLIEDKCEIVLHFKTLLVNQNIKNCVVKNRSDVEIDLRPLIDYNGNYEATVATNSSDARYYLNICRPLNSKYSLDCHGNSAACRTVIKDGKHEEELSLGHFEYVMSTEPGKDGTTNVIMKYFHGSKCPEDNDEHIATTIKFFCDELVGLGNPILKSTEHCEYSFDFPTNILCDEQHLKLKSGDSCELWNDKTNKSINLKTFGIFKNDNVKVDICDNEEKIYSLYYKDSMVVIEYAKHQNDIQVQLKCGLNNNTKIDVSLGQILVMSESTLICPFMNVVPRAMEFVATPKINSEESSTSAPSNDKQLEPSSSGFPLGYLFLITILIVAFGAFYIVLRNPERREILLNMVKFRSRRNIRYARVNMHEESALLTDNNELIASDSDDENILL